MAHAPERDAAKGVGINENANLFALRRTRRQHEMNAPMPRVPASLAGDSSDVAVALEVAGALWDKGDSEEAIRWLKRAAEAADQGGDASRGAILARAAGDLEAALEGARQTATGSPPGALPTPTAPSMSSASLPNAARGDEGHLPGAAGAPTPDARIRVSVKTSARDPDLLLLRPLPAGQAPPVGTREGFLVLAEPQVDVRSHSNGGGSQ
jgi:hypothetical protein